MSRLRSSQVRYGTLDFQLQALLDIQPAFYGFPGGLWQDRCNEDLTLDAIDPDDEPHGAKAIGDLLFQDLDSGRARFALGGPTNGSATLFANGILLGISGNPNWVIRWH